MEEKAPGPLGQTVGAICWHGCIPRGQGSIGVTMTTYLWFPLSLQTAMESWVRTPYRGVGHVDIDLSDNVILSDIERKPGMIYKRIYNRIHIFSYINELAQDCSNSIINTLELPKYGVKLSIWYISFELRQSWVLTHWSYIFFALTQRHVLGLAPVVRCIVMYTIVLLNHWRDIITLVNL